MPVISQSDIERGPPSSVHKQPEDRESSDSVHHQTQSLDTFSRDPQSQVSAISQGGNQKDHRDEESGSHRQVRGEQTMNFDIEHNADFFNYNDYKSQLTYQRQNR